MVRVVLQEELWVKKKVRCYLAGRFYFFYLKVTMCYYIKISKTIPSFQFWVFYLKSSGDKVRNILGFA